MRGELIGGNGVDSRVYMALDAVSGQIMAVKQKEIPKADLSSFQRMYRWQTKPSDLSLRLSNLKANFSGYLTIRISSNIRNRYNREHVGVLTVSFHVRTFPS